MAYNLEQTHPEEQSGIYVETGEPEDAPRPTRLLRAVIAAAVMTVFAGGLWFAYVQGKHHAVAASEAGDIPLIRADTRPYKVKPEHPGGMQMPDRDLFIYGEQRPQVEHLLPPPEQPMARPVPPAPAPTPQPVPTQSALAAQQAPTSTQATPPVAAQSEAAAPAATAGVPPSRAPAAIASAAATPAVVAPAKSGTTGNTVHPSSDPIGDKIQQLALVSAASPPKSATGRNLPDRPGGLRLQLGAARSDSEAHAQWERLKHQNADVLGRLAGAAIRADLGDRGIYYRIQAGPIADTSTADRLCAELHRRHLACMIVR